MPLVGRSVTPRSKVLHNMRMPLVGRSAKLRSIVLHKKVPLVGRSVKPRSIVLHKSRSIVLHSGKVPEGRSARPQSRKLHSMKMPVSRPHGPALFSGVGSLVHGLGAYFRSMRHARPQRQAGREERPALGSRWAAKQNADARRKKGGAPSYGHCPGAFPAVSASLPPDSEPGAAIPSRVRRAMHERHSLRVHGALCTKS